MSDDREATSNADRASDADLDALLRELSSRTGRGGAGRGLKFAAWRATVRLSYALKRAMDIVGSGVGMVLLSPVFLAIAIAVKRSSPGPVFFSQVRVGCNGRHFKFHKFRSMRQDAEALKESLSAQNESKDGVIFKMKDDPRITKVGRFLRRTSLDAKEVQEYTLEDRKRLDVIPGITCLWQIGGRSDIPFKEQVRLDKDYILSQSIWKDILILLKTIPAIVGGKGAY